MRKVSWDAIALGAVATSCGWKLYSTATRTEVGDADAAECVPYNKGIITKSVVEQLDREGLVIIKNVLSPKDLKLAREGCVDIHKEGRMKAMNPEEFSYRQDSICWIRESDGLATATNSSTALVPATQKHDPNEPEEPKQPLVANLESQIKPLSESLLGCIGILRGIASSLEHFRYERSSNLAVPKQCQLSRYAGNGGSGYKAHMDAAPSNDFWNVGLLQWLEQRDLRRRSVTAILYLNDADWNSSDTVDGGSLRCYTGNNDASAKGQSSTTQLSGADAKISNDSSSSSSVTVSDKNSTDDRCTVVSPAGGTLVLFDSRRLLHEVTPSHRDRYALTLWILGDDDSNTTNNTVTTS